MLTGVAEKSLHHEHITCDTSVDLQATRPFHVQAAHFLILNPDWQLRLLHLLTDST